MLDISVQSHQIDYTIDRAKWKQVKIQWIEDQAQWKQDQTRWKQDQVQWEHQTESFTLTRLLPLSKAP